MPHTPDLLACLDGVTDETLSALRDELLPAAEAARLRTHAATCPACQARLAQYDDLRRALLDQPELEPGERIVAGVRERLGARPARRLALLRGVTHAPRRWGGLGALAAAAAVLLLFVYVLGTHPGRQLASGKATPSAAATMTPDPSPSATPPLSPVTDVATAWGSHAALATLTPTDGTRYFITTAITPDGRSLLGQESPSPVGTPIGPDLSGAFDIASRQFHALFRGAQLNPVQCCQTDGRFVVGFDYDQPGATGGVFHRRYWAYDLTTARMREVAFGGTYQGITDTYLSSGVLLLVTGIGVEAASLATGSIAKVAGLPETGAIWILSFTWPYVVYQAEQANAAPAVHIRDLTTGRNIVLHQLDRFEGKETADQGAALVGNTLFYSVGTRTDVNADTANFTTLYEMDAPLDAQSQLHMIAAFGGDLGELMGANERLVLFQGAAWDRAEGRFVEFTQNGVGIPTALAGSYFVLYEATSAGGPQQVTVFDTNRLSVRTGK